MTPVFALQSWPEQLNFSACLPFKPILRTSTIILIWFFFFLWNYAFQILLSFWFFFLIGLLCISKTKQQQQQDWDNSHSFSHILYPEEQWKQKLVKEECSLISSKEKRWECKCWGFLDFFFYKIKDIIPICTWSNRNELVWSVTSQAEWTNITKRILRASKDSTDMTKKTYPSNDNRHLYIVMVSFSTQLQLHCRPTSYFHFPFQFG